MEQPPSKMKGQNFVATDLVAPSPCYHVLEIICAGNVHKWNQRRLEIRDSH